MKLLLTISIILLIAISFIGVDLWLITMPCLSFIFLFIALGNKKDEAMIEKKARVKKNNKEEVVAPDKKTWGRDFSIFNLIFIPYALIYFIQGFMSYTPRLWPLIVVWYLSAGVFSASKREKWAFFIALCLFSIAVDLSSYNADAYPHYENALSKFLTSDGYGYTYVFSPVLIFFWGLYLFLKSEVPQEKKHLRK